MKFFMQAYGTNMKFLAANCVCFAVIANKAGA